MKKIYIILVLIFCLFITISCKSDNLKTLNKVRTYFDFPTEVTSDLDFPTEITIDNKIVILEWETSDEEVISKDGKVHPREEDEDVLISVSASIGDDTVKYNLITTKVPLKIKKVFSITYDLDGGTCKDLVTSFKEGDKVVLPTPKKEGFLFLGWYEGKEKVEVIKDKIYHLKAKWMEGTENISVSFGDEPVYVGMDYNIEVLGFSNVKLFDITSSDESVAYVDDDYFLVALKKGKTTLSFTLKEFPTIKGSVEVEVLNRVPVLYRDNEPIIVGDIFNLKLSRYDDVNLFNISFDNEYLSYEDGTFKALKEGRTTITYTLKEDQTTFGKYELTIYPVKPVLAISSNEVTIGGTTRIDILNYEDLNKLKIEVNEEIASIDGRLITALARGDIRVIVSLVDNPDLSSYLDIHVLPVIPEITLLQNDILVGKKTYLFIDNLDQLEDKNLDNYLFNISDNTIVSNLDYSFTGLKEGEVTIEIVNKNDLEVRSSVNLRVIPSPTKYDEENEVAEGKLYVYHKDLEDFTGYIHAGEMDYLEIAGAHDLTKYNWITSNTKVLSIFEDGRYIAIGQGSATIMVARKTNNEVVGKINIRVYGEPDVDYAGRLIAIATSQLGYVEGPNNDTKYGRWYGIPDGEWCAMFVSWCANQAGISTDIIPKYAACTVGREWFESRGLFQYKEDYIPKAGDIIFFLSNGAGHTGIVINCDGRRVYTIEGNTSDMCAKRNYDLMYNKITGYGTPNYPPFSGSTSGGDTSGSTDGSGSSTH